MGHEERFRPLSLSGRCRLGEATFAGTRGNGRDAPKPDIRLETILLPLDPAADAPRRALRSAGALYFFGTPRPDREPLAAKRFRKLAQLA
jgi:hypothetical protein